MGKISLKHARLAESVSVALVKDEESGVRFWRYRYVTSSKSGTFRKYEKKDYDFEEFNSLLQFKSRIEYERELEKNLKENISNNTDGINIRVEPYMPKGLLLKSKITK